MAFVTSGHVGTRLTEESTFANHFLRHRVPTDEGDYIFGVAQGDLTTAMWVTMLAGGTCRALLASNVALGEQVLVGVGSITSANFGWFQANGRNIHGRVGEIGTVQHALGNSTMFLAFDSGHSGDAGFMSHTSLGQAGSVYGTAGSVNAYFFPNLHVAEGYVAVAVAGITTGQSCIFESAGDIYGTTFRSLSSLSN